MTKIFSHHIENVVQALKIVKVEEIERLCEKLVDTWNRNGTVYVCGNGGSAALAQHFAVDLFKGVRGNKPNARTVSLVDNIPLLTAISNDISYSEVFSFQIEGLVSKQDLLVFISGSGNSTNVLTAISKAQSKEVYTFGIFGLGGGLASRMVNDRIEILTDDMQVFEDLSSVIIHALLKKLI